MRSAIRTGRPPAPVHRARCSISFVFFVNGFLLASWLPHIPEVKERLALNDLQLGIALLAMAAGAVLALPFAGWLTGMLGSRLATKAACLALCLFLPAPVLAPTLPILMLALLLLGAANATLACSPDRPYAQIASSRCEGTAHLVDSEAPRDVLAFIGRLLAIALFALGILRSELSNHQRQ